MKKAQQKKLDVMLICEGTYPYNSGGVSTWAHDLCTRTENIDFTIYTINAVVEKYPRYELGASVKKIIQVPIWSPEEPFDCVDYDLNYSKIVQAREQTYGDDVLSTFNVIFKTFIQEIYREDQSVSVLDACFYEMWLFFQTYDFRETMGSELIWESYCSEILNLQPPEERVKVTLEDLTTGMRWLYRLLLPMAIQVPRVDVSHVTISGIAVIPALWLKYKYKTPILVTEHGVFIRERLIAISTSNYSYFLKKLLINFSVGITKLVYFHSDRITTVSKFNISWEKYYGADLSKIQVIYNGVDHNAFKPRPKPEHLANIPTVVSAARIFELKDILTMIRTCNEVRKQLPTVQFLVYGNKDAVPEYTKACEALIRELGCEKNFFLKGFHKKPDHLYCDGDLSILTSISEGFPFTVIESMSCGVPVVSTDVGGVTEALDSSCGFVCKPKDFKELAEKVLVLLRDPVLRNLMGRNARQKVIDNFTIENFTDKFQKVYSDLAKNETEEKPIENEVILKASAI